MNWRIRKKRGLLNTAADQELKELIRKEIEAEAEVLERRAEQKQLGLILQKKDDFPGNEACKSNLYIIK